MSTTSVSPAPLRPLEDSRPFFIVGCPRSGTTLLRLMLDQHPSLAIPDESHFVVELWHHRHDSRPADVAELVLAHPRFQRWGVDPDLVRRAVTEARPRSYAELMHLIFAAYAQSRGKPRWGDKSPPYLGYIGRLATIFPTAQFVHLIRDGREVAVSLSGHAWGQPSAIAAATFWRRQVAKGRRAGRRLGRGRYLEVRYEELLRRPHQVLSSICEFLGEPFTPRLLDYRSAAAASVWSGTPGDPDYVDHRHLAEPLTEGIRDWREGLTPGQQQAIDTAAQPLLRELGYSSQPRSLAALVRVQVDQVRRLPRSIWSEARKSLLSRWR